MCFEWDEKKNILNIEKHGISFDEAVKVFLDPMDITLRSTVANHEIREITIGKTSFSKMESELILVVVHTHRDSNTRVISARRASRKERGIYDRRFKITL